MKKLLGLLMIAMIGFTAQAQEKVKTEIKGTTTPVQKVHNTFSKHKHYKGYKRKHKHSDGSKHVKKVNMETGDIKKKDKMK